MKRFSIYIITLLLFAPLNVSFSQVSILDLKKQAGEYSLDFTIWKSDGITNQVSANELKLTLNSATSSFNLKKNTSSFVSANKSILISLDISNAYNLINFEISKKGLQGLLNKINFQQPELALTTYNTNVYLNQDWTNDYTKILDEFPYLSLFGASNFENVFFHNFAGAENIFKNAKYEKNIIVIADSYTEANINTIQQYLEKDSIHCYMIYLNQLSPPSLQSLEETNSNFKIITCNSDQNSFDLALDKVIKEIYKIETFNLTFKSKLCGDSLAIALDYQSKQYKVNFDFPQNWKVNLKPLPNNSIEFTKVDANIPKDTIVELFSEFDSIKIQSLVTNSSLLKFQIQDSLAFSNKSAKVKLTYLTSDTSYFKTKVDVLSSACNNLSFNFEAGTKTKLNNNSTIKIISPKLNENLISGNPTIIRWEGTSSLDTFKLEYTSDDGNSWNLISKTATSNSYSWLVPNKIAEYRIKISELAKNNIYDRVIYYNVPNNTFIDKISWSNGDFLSFSTDKGELYVMNPFNQINPVKLSSDLKKVNDLKFGKFGTKIATSIDASTSNSNLILFDADETQPPIKFLGNAERPKSLSWNTQSNMLFAGDFNGNLDIWNLTSPNSQTLSFPLYHTGAINAIEISDKKNIIITAGSDSWLKFRNMKDWVVYNDSLNLNDGNNDETVSMELVDSDNRLLLATKNSNIHYYNLYQNDTIFAPSLKSTFKADNSFYNQIGAYRDTLLYTSKNKINLINTNNVPLFNYAGHTSQITCFDASNKGYVASADIRGGLQVWKLSDYPFDKKVLETSQSDNFKVIDLNLKIEDINLGNYCLGKVLTKSISNYIINQTNAEIIIDSIVINKDVNNEFRITNTFPAKISANEAFELRIDFAPTIESNKFLDITVFTGNFKFTKVLTAVGYDPKYEVSNSVIDFGNVNIEESSTITDKLIITNSSSLDLKILNFEYQSKDTIFKLSKNGLPVSVPITIAPNKSESFEVSFSPKFLERYNVLLRFNTQEFCTPIFVNLVGSGVAPSLNSTKYILKPIECANERIDTLLKIKNTGKGILKITEVKQISGNANCKVSIINGSANSNEEITLRCEYIDNIVRQDSNVFQLTTNRLIDGSSGVNISIITKKDSIGIYTKDTIINFIVPTVNKSASQIISVKNIGSKAIDWSKENFSIAYFELKSIKPIICQPNESSQFEFFFTGSNKDTTLQAGYFISDGCLQKTINLVAVVGSKETNIGFNPSYDAGMLECSDSTIIKVPIKNIGKNELIVSNIQIMNDLLNEIKLSSPTTTILSVDSIYNIELTIRPIKLKTKDIQLAITSNAKNVPNSEAIINLSFEKKSNSFEKTNDTIALSNIILNTTHNFTYKLKYTGNVPLSITTPVILSNNYTLDSISPKFILPDSSVTFYFSFIAMQLGNVTSNYNFSNNCRDSLNITINALVSGSNYINIALPQISSKTGDIVAIKPIINNPKQLNLAFLVDATIKFIVNNSIAVPKFNWISDTIINGKRHTKAKFDATQEYKYLTTLGDSNLTKVDFEILPLVNPDLVSILTESGKITLTDVCYEGNSRYVIGTGNFKFSTPFPNPCNDVVNFEISAIEKGNYVLNLYDEMGNFVKNLLDKELSPSTITVTRSLLDIPIGGYYCKLSTPSEVYFRKLIIIR